MKRVLIAVLVILATVGVLPVFAGGGQQAGDMVTIDVVGASLGQELPGLPGVQDAVNRILAPMGFRANFTMIPLPAHPTTIPLMMAAREKIDVLSCTPNGAANFLVLRAQNQVQDITDLYREYGSELNTWIEANLFPNFLGPATFDGRLFGIPGVFNKVANNYILARGDIIDKHGLNFGNLQSIDEMEALLREVGRLEPTIGSPLVPNQMNAWSLMFQMNNIFYPGSFRETVFYDQLGFADNIAVVLENDPRRVVNFYSLPQVKANFLRVRQMFNDGLVYRDGLLMQEMQEEIIRANRGFLWITRAEIGLEVPKEAQTGFPVKAQIIADSPINTSNHIKYTWVVPVQSRHAREAVQFMNKMFTSSEISNLLIRGIEGRDYVIRDGHAAFPPGMGPQNVPYRGADHQWGNQYLSLPWEGSTPNLRQEALRQNREAIPSEVFGFVLDITPIQNEAAAISSVIQRFLPGLACGAVADVEGTYNAFLAALDSAGMPRVLSVAQQQLDAWWRTR